MTAKPIEYPVTLTNKDWQKKKGLLAKGAGETGVGEHMDKLQAEFKKINWGAYNAKLVCDRANGVFTPGQAAIKLKEAGAAFVKDVSPARAAAQKLRDVAQKTADEWKKNKLIPSSSQKHAVLVAQEADTLFMSLKDNSIFMTEVIKDFTDEKNRLQRNVDLAIKGLTGNFVDLQKYAKEVLATPTVASYRGDATKGFHQKVRGTAAALKALSDHEAYKKAEPTWKTYASDGFPPKEDGQVKAKVMTVLKSLQELMAIKV